jgi:hypothetical protein
MQQRMQDERRGEVAWEVAARGRRRRVLDFCPSGSFPGSGRCWRVKVSEMSFFSSLVFEDEMR